MNYPSDVLEPIQQFLETKKAELLARKERLTLEDPFSDPESRLNNNAAVDADAAEQFGHETADAMKDEVERKIAEVERALLRVSNGTYGTCAGCGLMIDTDRLTVDPIAEFCVVCQRKKTVATS